MIKRVRISKLKTGDIIAKDIMIEGRKYPLVVKDTVVNEYIKSRLEELQITSISIFDPEYKEESKTPKDENEKLREKKREFKKQYNKNTSDLKNVFTGIAKGEKVNIQNITSISTNLFNSTDDIFAAIESIGEIKQMDENTYAHSINVALYSILLGKWLELEESEVKSLAKAGVLHDIGKSKVDQDILHKPGKLTEDEFKEIQKHTVYGYEICKPNIWISEEIKNGVLMHHEKIDGSGYPLGLKGSQLSLYPKILAVCDVYDALNSKRSYKAKQTPFDTFKQMIEIGNGKLDFKIMGVFLIRIMSLYIGAKVKMNTGEIGEIAFIPPENMSNPIVKINNNYYDLSKNQNYKIEEMC